jgi:hypothetical protein
MLHEHREFFPEDPSTQVNDGEMQFRDEDGISFAVEAHLATSAAHAKEALAHWLRIKPIGRNSYGNRSADAT